MSTAQAKVDVLLSGKTLPDADPDQAVAAFARLTGIDPEQARTLITGGKPKMVKRGLALEEGQIVVNRFAAIGIEAVMRQTAVSVSSTPPSSDSEAERPVQTVTTNGAALPQETAISPQASAKGGETVCPKCGHRQLGGEECTNCGIIFRKSAKQNEPDDPQPEQPLLAESYCTNCGKPMAAQAPACTHCGLPPRLERKHCPNCGATTDPRQVLCVKCGADLAAPQASPTPTSGKARPVWLLPALIGGGALALLGIVLAVVLLSRDKTGGVGGPVAASAKQSASSASVDVPADASFAATVRAAERGEVEAQWKLGMAYEKGENGMPLDREKSTIWLLKAANQGHAASQTVMGLKYRGGLGVAKDLKQMAYWYRKAADQGFARAQFYLGDLYLAGVGVPENEEMAAYWYRKAADQGDADAQYSLGLMYGSGTGVPLDLEKGLELFRKAAAQGHEKAHETLRELSK